jgi:putative ABC transport system ATP-binding protein
VLQDLDLRIAQGEFVALMGPSGSGKTTILNLIGGLDRPQAGAANVELPLLLTRLTRAERQAHADAALALVGLGHRAAHKPGEMSGGQQQRVGIARAIVTDPSILLCDEPTGDLDRKSADEILTLLQMLNRERGKAIVMVTHDQKAAEFAGRELHLDKGALTGKTRT